jgi:hypothetical protein
VPVNEMMTNFQHKHHICKSCHKKKVAERKRKERKMAADRIEESAKIRHDKAVYEANELMGKPAKKQKLKASMFKQIDDKHDEIEMKRLLEGEEF